MNPQSSPVRPAATGSDTAANTTGTPVSSNTILADWAVLVAMGTTMSTPSDFTFSRIVESAAESPSAFRVTISNSTSLPSSSETMVSRI